MADLKRRIPEDLADESGGTLMARSLKTRGLAELDSLRRRARRQHSLGRIDLQDLDFLMVRIQEIEARIVTMRELNEQGEEEG